MCSEVPAVLMDVQLPRSVPVPEFNTMVIKDDFSLLSGKFNFAGVDYTWEQVLDICKGLNILYRFSGHQCEGDFSSACHSLGASATLVDTVLDFEDMDLLDEAVFE